MVAGDIRRERLTLDAHRRDSPPPMLRYRCGDEGTKVDVFMQQGGVPLEMDGLTATLVAECPAGLLRCAMEVDGCRATYTVGPPLTSAPGMVRPYVELSLDGVLVASTGHFLVRVDPGPDAPPAELARYRSELDGLIEEARRLNESFASELEDMAARAEEAIAAISARADSGEFDGATFTPSVDADGVLSWENDRGLPNPEPVCVRGPKGDDGGASVVGDLPTMTDADIDELFE